MIVIVFVVVVVVAVVVVVVAAVAVLVEHLTCLIIPKTEGQQESGACSNPRLVVEDCPSPQVFPVFF